jgi:hypothetical protein
MNSINTKRGNNPKGHPAGTIKKRISIHVLWTLIQ